MPNIHAVVDDGLQVLTIERPERKNALTQAMYAELASQLRGAAGDDAVRVTLLRGSHGVFTAGNDLSFFAEAPARDAAAAVIEFLAAISTYPKPLVVQTEGPAIGIGTTLLLHADLIYAADNTIFSLPFVNLGIVPEAASSLLLPAMCGHARAAELLMLGGRFDSRTALELGLITAVVPLDEVAAYALGKARQLLDKPLRSLLETKRLMKAPRAEQIQQVMEAELQILIDRLQSPEAAEALRAFFEKRKPDFRQFS